MDKKSQYYSHAEKKLLERKISKEKVEETLRKPENTLPGKNGRNIAEKFYGNRKLRVIYEEKDNHYKVVTAYYTNKERYG